jgi:diadenosine tetraphosphatase ApaH/serine/threonine PP2A family protein phosphatase
MLIAILTDIHANREALTACLADARSRNVGRHVFLGDYVGYGADPGWVVDTVISHVDCGATAILGNHDAAVLTTGSHMNETAHAAIEWTRTRLDETQCKFLGGLPLTVEENDRLYVHANAWAPGGWGYVTGSGEARRSLQATVRRLTFCGHVHVPELYFETVTGKIAGFTPVAGTPIPLLPQRRWLAVIGAVGQPRDGVPAACYGLFDDETRNLIYVRVPYDVEGAARKIRAAGLPPVLALRLEQGY